MLATDAVVLHVFDYLESSRILRLATREAGVQSVLARGARRSRSRYGSALDLYAEGVAQIHLKVGRDLQTLASFEVQRARPQLAADLGRFTGAAAVAELALRFVREEASPPVYESLVQTLDLIAGAPSGATREATLAGAWRLVSLLGFAPAVDLCALCHAPLAGDSAVVFSHPAGGALCARCGRTSSTGRLLPAEARRTLQRWLTGHSVTFTAPRDARAHQRLLREFLREHLAEDRALRAFDVWECAPWSPA